MRPEHQPRGARRGLGWRRLLTRAGVGGPLGGGLRVHHPREASGNPRTGAGRPETPLKVPRTRSHYQNHVPGRPRRVAEPLTVTEGLLGLGPRGRGKAHEADRSRMPQIKKRKKKGKSTEKSQTFSPENVPRRTFVCMLSLGSPGPQAHPRFWEGAVKSCLGPTTGFFTL